MVAAVKDMGPLDWRVPIVDGSGRPSPEFQRRWNTQRDNDAQIPTDFVQLHDVPNDYTGAALKLLQVKSDETGLQYVTNPNANLVLAGPSSGAAAVPSFRSLVVADLPSLGDGNFYANISGGVGAPTAQSLSVVLDYVFGNARGNILFRGASGWSVLAPGAAGKVLQTNGAGADPSWVTASGGGGAETLISTATPSGTGTVTFSSIPATYRDLRVVIRGRGTAAALNVVVNMQFNNDTGANYDRQRLTGVNGGASAAALVAQTQLDTGGIAAGSAPAGLADVVEVLISDYAGTTFEKAAIARSTQKTGTTTANLTTDQRSLWWRSTAAINRVDVILAAGNFAAGSTVSLYGRL